MEQGENFQENTDSPRGDPRQWTNMSNTALNEQSRGNINNIMHGLFPWSIYPCKLPMCASVVRIMPNGWLVYRKYTTIGKTQALKNEKMDSLTTWLVRFFLSTKTDDCVEIRYKTENICQACMIWSQNYFQGRYVIHFVLTRHQKKWCLSN